VIDDLQPAYVLHSRLYRETSLIVELFSRDHGIIPAVARGVRGTRRNHKRAILQPFHALLCRWRGRGEMVTLTDIDAKSANIQLDKEALYCGLYINELLIRLIHRHDPHQQLFHDYANLIDDLQNSTGVEASLRQFEMQLLDELGYGLTLDYDIHGAEILADRIYQLTPQGIFEPVPDTNAAQNVSRYFKGDSLIAIMHHRWQEPGVLLAAKQLMRLVITPLLGDKPLQSRQLFKKH
jgi:DNA repair protein RecO (recombination protein O)